MNIRRLIDGIYPIKVYCNSSWESPVLEFLEDAKKCSPSTRKKMDELFEQTAMNGLPNNIQRCKQLKGAKGIWEFKCGPRNGAELRVLFFVCNKEIICTGAFTKRDKTDETTISKARKIRAEYLQEAKGGLLLCKKTPR